MKSNKLHSTFLKKFSFEPTEQQGQAIDELCEFVDNTSNRGIFVLKGFAGTGKTTLVSALVNSLWPVGIKVVLLAPTGRAAKVLSFYSKKKALTIHKKIYWVKSNASGGTYVTLQENKHSNTIFVVDEASMIPDVSDKGFGGRSLLEDLIEFVYSGVNCKLILLGDTAQLPPVHLDVSPALNDDLLGITFKREVSSLELTEVVRQQNDSLILENATNVRNQIKNEQFGFPKFKCNNDFKRLNDGMEIQDALEDAYSKSGVDGTVVLCKSNKRANLYNKQIRAKIRWQEDELSVGDFLMIVRNNYYWLPKESKVGFLANGDTVEVLRIYEFNELYGMRFARISVRLLDYPDEESLEVIVMLDLLASEVASLSYEQYKLLHDEVAKDFTHIPKKQQRNKEIKLNPFFNALQVKFSYAITCHKSQGGQWEHVFIEQGYFTKEMLNKEYFRWLYTALTRSTKKVYLINFKSDFFEKQL